MISKLIVAVLDGAFALFQTTSHLRTYLSDVVTKTLDHYNKASRAYLYYHQKGTLISTYKNVMRRFIQDNNQASNELLLCGKSLGAKNAVELFNELRISLKYEKINLLLVDAVWIGKLLNQTSKLKIKPIGNLTHVYNFFQTNEQYLKGAEIDDKNLEKLVYQIDMTETKFDDGNNVNHWNIIEHPYISGIINSILKTYFK